MSELVDLVQRHLRAGPDGVDLEDALWAELSAALERQPGATAAARLIDVAAALAQPGSAPPAAQKLVGAAAAILAALVAGGQASDRDIEAMRRRAAAVVGAPLSTALPGQPPPPGALKVGPGAFAALRTRKDES